MKAFKYLFTELRKGAIAIFIALWLLITTILRRLIRFVWGLLLPYRLTVWLIWRYLILPPLRQAWRIFRRIFRFLLVLGLLTGVLAFVRSSGVPSYEKPRALTVEEADLPPLTGEVDSVDIDFKRGEINVALIVDENGSKDDVANDMIAIYLWGREKLPPFVCGEGYPPNLCVQRWVKITWLSRSGSGGDLYRIFTIGLDQMSIDRLRERNPQGYEQLNKFLLDITEASGGTGVFYEEFTAPPEPFDGFK